MKGGINGGSRIDNPEGRGARRKSSPPVQLNELWKRTPECDIGISQPAPPSEISEAGVQSSTFQCTSGSAADMDRVLCVREGPEAMC